MTVLVSTGDGDCYAEGGNHLLHAIRRNIDVTVLVHNNGVYGLTKGQASPTSREGMRTRSQPNGVLSTAFNPLALVLAMGGGFVARGFSGDGDQLADLIQAGVRHRGFALIDVLQPCVSFNRVNTYQWYRERVAAIDRGHDPGDRAAAMTLALQDDDKRILTGIFYRSEKATLTDRIETLKDRALTDARYDAARLEAILRQQRAVG
jgi:2-oxoglutarate ferredoxin oxidoreductase subunit beta